MTDTNWAIPGAQVYLSKPTAAQAAAAAESRHRTALGTPEQWEAQREHEIAVLRARHRLIVDRATDPILKALIEAHSPHGDGRWPDCPGCPPVPNEYDSDPEDWPCSVWSFISDRMEAS